jgi:hypothetical protein
MMMKTAVFDTAGGILKLINSVRTAKLAREQLEGELLSIEGRMSGLRIKANTAGLPTTAEGNHALRHLLKVLKLVDDALKELKSELPDEVATVPGPGDVELGAVPDTGSLPDVTPYQDSRTPAPPTGGQQHTPGKST